MNRLIIFQSTMLITLVCGVLMALFLFRHRKSALQTSEQSPVSSVIVPLAAYNLVMGLWCAGHFLVTIGEPIWGLSLVALNPLMPTLFLHFAVCFINQKSHPYGVFNYIERYILWLYCCSIAVVIFNQVYSNDTVKPWLDFPYFVVFSQLSWFSLAYTVVVGFIAHGILALGYWNNQGNRKNTILLLFVAAGWGFLTASSFILPSLNVDIYPYLMWLIPSYIVFMTFAVLRYELFFVNRWAIKTIIWILASILILLLITLLTSAATKLGAQPLSNVDLDVIWLYSLFSGTILWLTYKPLNQLATRLVYPDITINQLLIDQWLSYLSQCHGYQHLAKQATELISNHIRQPVKVIISPSGQEPVSMDKRLIINCVNSDGRWQFELKNWQEASPGVRHVGEVFGPLVYSSCITLEKSLQLADEEKQRQQQLRLAELGGLSAALAHELRNPLNIISMASASTEPEIKQHIQQQLNRADVLIQDLLDYAKAIELKPQNITLRPLLEALVATCDKQYGCQFDIDCEPELVIYADVHKLQQVVVNCCDNAGAFADKVENGKVLISAKKMTNHIELAFHNNGPAISKQMQPELFKPFISKRPGGSGLGLAIVQRIMDAHQGRVYFSQSETWPVSFTCLFPYQTPQRGENGRS